jgi:cell shape-determining protein MreC
MKRELAFFFALERIEAAKRVLLSPFDVVCGAFKKVRLFSEKKQVLLDKINALHEELSEYKRITFDYNELKQQNEYLRGVSPIIRGLDLDTITATHRPDASHPFTVVVELPDAVAEKVAVGDVAVSLHGLFGRVVFKNKNNIMIVLATNLLSKIPVRSRQSKRRAILLGNNVDYLKIKYVQNEEELLAPGESGTDGRAAFEEQDGGATANGPTSHQTQTRKVGPFIEGEILETIAAGGFFPPGIPVAKIERRDENGEPRAKWVCCEENSEFVTIVFRKWGA